MDERMDNKKNDLKKRTSRPIEGEVFLGIDYGLKNIGLALGRAKLTIPLAVLKVSDEEAAIKEIAKFVVENQVSKVVMGLPLTAESKETQQSLKTRTFAKRLKIHVKKPVIFFNEHYSSKEALKEAISGGVSKKDRQHVDHISAAIILREYFETL